MKAKFFVNSCHESKILCKFLPWKHWTMRKDMRRDLGEQWFIIVVVYYTFCICAMILCKFLPWRHWTMRNGMCVFCRHTLQQAGKNKAYMRRDPGEQSFIIVVDYYTFCMCAMTLSYVCHEFIIRVPRLCHIYVCNDSASHDSAIHVPSLLNYYCCRLLYVLQMNPRKRGGGLGSRPKKMYGERLGDGVEYHLMSPTPRR